MRSYDYHVKYRPLRHLEPILKRWHDINVEYCDKYEDAMYWYTERTNVGALSTAVWLSGSQALEEFSATRGFGKDQREGRADPKEGVADSAWTAGCPADHGTTS